MKCPRKNGKFTCGLGHISNWYFLINLIINIINYLRSFPAASSHREWRYGNDVFPAQEPCGCSSKVGLAHSGWFGVSDTEEKIHENGTKTYNDAEHSRLSTDEWGILKVLWCVLLLGRPEGIANWLTGAWMGGSQPEHEIHRVRSLLECIRVAVSSSRRHVLRTLILISFRKCAVFKSKFAIFVTNVQRWKFCQICKKWAEKII